MKVLTLWQPWASLVALGVKTIETRSWDTDYRGPLAIHAAATTKGFDEIAAGEEAGWIYGELGDFQAAYCRRTSDEGVRGDTFLHCITGRSATTNPGPCPLGAIVATCTLTDVVPMVDGSLPIVSQPPRFLAVTPNVLALGQHDGRGCGEAFEVGHQRPYGDFTPGRFAWLLEDITPLDEPVPFTGGQKLNREWTP